MTICIAAIGTNEGKEYVIAATDKMLTNSLIGGSFEHPSPKFKIIGKKYIAMLAGNPLLFSELVNERISEGKDLKGVANNIKEAMKSKRLSRIDEEILGPLLADRKLISRALEKEIPNSYIDSILKAVAEFRLETAIILAGVEDHKASVLLISETGVHNFSEIGFHTIGTGDVEATNTLLFQQQSRETSVKETIYNVFKAKRNAEVAEGVGQLTDMIIIGEGKVIELNKEKIKILRQVYDKELKFGKNHKLLDGILNKDR